MQQGVGACAAASGLRFWWETMEHPAGELWELQEHYQGRASGILLGHLSYLVLTSACSSSANSHYSGRVLAHHSPPHCTQVTGTSEEIKDNLGKSDFKQVSVNLNLDKNRLFSPPYAVSFSEFLMQ